MDAKDIQVIADAINNLAAAIRETGVRISEAIATDESLNYTLGRELSKISEKIDRIS
jgi:hypothetical protein